ncbi:MAG: ATP-binding cassette domain-containing protein [Bacilli bacterium]|nr:ATP-binding cassette domain-containing protein [Bacilli bacterium]
MLRLQNVTIIKKDGERPLIKDFSFTLEKGDKAAVIGEEGDGKSTLLKFIYDSKLLDSYCTYQGEVIKQGRIGYLSQNLEEGFSSLTMEDYFLKKDLQSEKDLSIYNDFKRIQECLSRVKLSPELLFSYQPLSSLSGGEKVKMRMAKLLYLNPDILLLDEPTNDLDLSSLKWMEEFILSCQLPLLFVSHDEMLLSKTANRIIHLEQVNKKQEAKITVCSLDYLSYIEKRFHLIEKQNQVAQEENKQYEEKKERFLHVYDSVRYQQANLPKAGSDSAGRLLKKKMKALLSQRSRLEKESEELTKEADVEEAINLKFPTETKLKKGTLITSLDLKELKVQDRVLSNDIFLKAYTGDKIVIIGDNGVGKTTLLKTIYERLKDRKDLKVGYMPQNYEDKMDYHLLPLDFICPSRKKEDRLKAGEFLGALRFSSEEMLSPLSYLSSGQRGKLFLAKFILEEDDFLLLDEPTRNFSPLSNPMIRKALNSFKGGFIAISHDRMFISSLGKDVYLLTKQGLKKCAKEDIDEL